MKLDKIVLDCLNREFPGHRVPDAINYRSTGVQYKAPDHFIEEYGVYIERKSLNPQKTDLIERVNIIAAKQGHCGFHAFGRVNAQSMLKQLPDPARANREFGVYMLNQMMKRVKQAAQKLFEYRCETGAIEPALLVISDHDSETVAGSDFDEYYLGRAMLDRTIKHIDGLTGVMYLRDPRYTINYRRSSWCNMLYRTDAPAVHQVNVAELMKHIAGQIEIELRSKGIVGPDEKWRMTPLAV